MPANSMTLSLWLARDAYGIMLWILAGILAVIEVLAILAHDWRQR